MGFNVVVAYTIKCNVSNLNTSKTLTNKHLNFKKKSKKPNISYGITK